MGSTRKPSLAEVQRRATRAELEGVHSWMPGMVVKWSETDQRATIMPLVRVFRTQEDGSRVQVALPLVTNVPVAFPSGDGHCLTFPLKADSSTGSTGRLFFSEVSLDRWLAGSGGLVDPEIDVRFALSDACFEPGLRTFANPLKNVPADHATIGSETGPRIHMRPGGICIGDEAGAKALVLDGDVVNAGTLSGTVLVAGVPVSVQFIYTPAGGSPGALGRQGRGQRHAGDREVIGSLHGRPGLPAR